MRVLHIEVEVVMVISVMVPVFVHDDIGDKNVENENEKTLLTPTDSLVTAMTHQIHLFGSL